MNEYKFKSKDFYALLEKQEYKCHYSGRDLSPENTMAVHIIPLQQGGKHEVNNIVLVDRQVHYAKRYLKLAELLEMAVDLVRQMGANDGYKVTKRRPK